MFLIRIVNLTTEITELSNGKEITNHSVDKTIKLTESLPKGISQTVQGILVNKNENGGFKMCCNRHTQSRNNASIVWNCLSLATPHTILGEENHYISKVKTYAEIWNMPENANIKFDTNFGDDIDEANTYFKRF